MARDLPQGQIRPVAQPLSAFLEPTRQQVAAPAAPLEIPRVPGIRVIQQGGAGDVRGFNQFDQLASALAPFSQSLTQLAGTGLAAYASEEVRTGIDLAMRAKALLDAQQQQSSAEYAAENRKLAQTDPIGALMMDAVNPFRRSGIKRRLNNLAALEAKGAVISAYRNAKSPQLWAEGDPRLAGLKVEAINGLRAKYKIDEGSPGFANVLAQLNEGADRVTEMHWQDRQSYIKSTVPATAVAEIYALYNNSLRDKQVEYFMPDGTMRIIKQGDVEWDTARSLQMTAVLDRLAEEMGIPGEVTTVKKQVYEELLAFAHGRDDGELKRLVESMLLGPVRKDGTRTPGVFTFPTIGLDAEIKYGELAYKRKQREREQLGSRYQDLIIQNTYQVPDGPERLAALEQLRNSPEFADLPLNEKLELEQKTSTTVDAVASRGRSVDGVSALLLDMSGRYGTAWNTGQADAEFERALAGAPEDKKPELRRQYAELRDRNSRREAAPTTREVNAVIDGKIRASLRASYPGTTTEAALRGGDIEAVIAGLTDANAKESARRQYSAFQGYVRSRVAAEEARKGRPLTTAEATEIATRAVDEYGSSDKKQRAYLFPGVDGQPGIQGIPVAPAQSGGAAAPGAPPGTRPFSGRVYPSGQLDNVPGRDSLVSQWRDRPVLDATSIVQEVNRIIAGGSPSAALRRFARDANTTPGALLNKQIDFYRDSIQISPAERQKLLRDGRQASAAASNARGSSSPSSGPVAQAQGLMLDLMFGWLGGRANAATLPQSSITRLPAGQQVALRSRPQAPSPAPPPTPALSSPTLNRLGGGGLFTPKANGLCVTTVLETMRINGIPNPPATGADSGNNPRGLAAQLVRSYGWKPLPGIGRPRTLNSPYGSFTVNQMSLAEYQAAAQSGRVPSGAVVFQTRNDWSGNASRSRGFDAAIARNGGRNLWNGTLDRSGRGVLIGPAVYGSATRQVFVLVPSDSIRDNRTARR